MVALHDKHYLFIKDDKGWDGLGFFGSPNLAVTLFLGFPSQLDSSMGTSMFLEGLGLV